jgi:hypothetical protein
VSDILADIIREDRRAGEVIRRLRALLKRGEAAWVPVLLNEAIEGVLHLAQGDLIGRGVAVRGNRVPILDVASRNSTERNCSVAWRIAACWCPSSFLPGTATFRW